MSVGAWASKHPWMTFFIVTGAIGAVRAAVTGVRGESSIAGFGADYLGPGSPGYDYSQGTDIGTVYTAPATDPNIYAVPHVADDPSNWVLPNFQKPAAAPWVLFGLAAGGVYLVTR